MRSVSDPAIGAHFHWSGRLASTGRPGLAHVGRGMRRVPSDLVVAETIDVLESFHEAPRDVGAEAVRAFEPVICVDPSLLLRPAEVHEVDHLDVAEAHLVALAATTGVGGIASQRPGGPSDPFVGYRSLLSCLWWWSGEERGPDVGGTTIEAVLRAELVTLGPSAAR